jgi:hypothetical protein
LSYPKRHNRHATPAPWLALFPKFGWLAKLLTRSEYTTNSFFSLAR